MDVVTIYDKFHKYFGSSAFGRKCNNITYCIVYEKLYSFSLVKFEEMLIKRGYKVNSNISMYTYVEANYGLKARMFIEELIWRG